MSQFSNFLEDALFNATLRNIAFVSPATVYVGLFTTDPTDAASGTEVTGGSYARQSATFNAPSNGSGSNSADITFPVATVDWGTITHAALFNAVTAGDMFYYAPVTLSKLIQTGDQYVIKTGQLTVTLQ